QKAADLLVKVGLWEPAEGGFQIHDYLDYNPSADDVRAEQARISESRAKAGRMGGIASGIARRKHSRSKGEAKPKQEGSNEDEPAADPLEASGSKTKPRPDPTPSASNEAESEPRK